MDIISYNKAAKAEEKVSELRSAVTEEKGLRYLVLDETQFEGGYIGTDGAVHSSSNYKHSPFIRCAFQKIRFNCLGSSATVECVAFYQDADFSSFISGYENPVSLSTYTEHEMTVPYGTKYIIFSKNVTNTNTANISPFVFSLDTAEATMERIEQRGYITPEMFGAKGDGITDDTDALNECFSGGSKTILLTKVYAISESISVGSNTTVIGVNGSKIKKDNTEKSPVLYAKDANNISLDGVTIEGSMQYDGLSDASANIEVGAFFDGSCNNIRVIRCNITKCGNAQIRFYAITDGFVKDCYLSYNNVADSFDSGDNYNFGISTYDSVNGLTIADTEVFDAAIGIYITHGGSGIVVTNCFVHGIGGQHGFYCSTSNFDIENTRIDGCASNGINVQHDAKSIAMVGSVVRNCSIKNAGIGIVYNDITDSQTACFSNVILTGNEISNCSNAISYGSVDGITISGNIVRDILRNGISARQTEYGNTNVTIDSNLVQNVGEEEVSGYNLGIYVLDSDGVMVSSNKIISTDGKMAYGIYVLSSATSVRVTNNIIIGAKTNSARTEDISSIASYDGNIADKVTNPLVTVAQGRALNEWMGTAVPESGYHAKGEIVYNASPTAGGFVGWICISGGTPGTWKQFGAIEA